MSYLRQSCRAACAAVLLSCSLLQAEEPRALPAPDYRSLLERYYELYAETSPMSALQDPKTEAATSPAMAIYSLRLWQATKTPEYLERGAVVFGNIIAAERPFGQFDTAPLVQSAIILKSADRLTPQQSDRLRQRFLEIQSKGYQFRHGNRELGRLYGPAIAAFELFKDDAAFEPTREQFRAWWPRQNAIGDLDENAGNYSSLGLAELVGIVRAMGREQDLAASPKWRNTFERYRDSVSPGGHMPEWNNDYFQEGGWHAFLYLFEYAAHLYNDPTFETAARKCYHRQLKAQALLKHGSQHTDLHELASIVFALPLLDLQPMQALAPEPLTAGITQRVDELGRQVDDKVILRPSNAPGSPMIWIDVYAEGDHSHTSKKGSIGYYEVDQVPLFRGGYGRRVGTQTGDGGNSFYLQPDGETFPIDTWKPDTWKTISLKAETAPLPGNPADPDQRLVTQLRGTGPSIDVTEMEGEAPQADRVKQLSPDSAVYIANLRLEGPAGVKLIDDFTSTGKAPRNTTLVTYQGKHALKVSPASGRFETRPYNVTFNPADYKVLSYDILQTGNLLSIDFRVPPGPNGKHTYGAWHRIAPGPFYGHLAGAETQIEGSDCAATITYDGYGTWDSTLTRRVVLTAEGVLVIRDTFTPGASAAGWTGGSVWQLPTLAAKGPNWFASEIVEEVANDPRDTQPRKHGMLVLFAGRNEKDCGVQTSVYGKNQSLKRYIAYSKLPLESGVPVTAVTVVLPTDEGVEPSTYANGVTARTAGPESQVDIALPGRSSPLTVRVSDKTFSVTRPG